MLYIKNMQSLNSSLFKRIVIIIMIPLIVSNIYSIYIIIDRMSREMDDTNLILLMTILFNLLICNIILIIIYRLRNKILDSLNKLLDSTDKIIHGEYDFHIPGIKLQEFYSLSESFGIMSEKILLREAELSISNSELNRYKLELENKVKQRTNELEKSLNHLKSTQKHLIESEKNSSLKNLVIGISHEMNTPIGVIITGSTYLQDVILADIKSLNSKLLTKEMLTDDLAKTKETLDLIYNNSKKVALLIDKFKMISTEDNSDVVRTFSIKNYIEDILSGIRSDAQEKNVNIQINCIDDLEITTYAGALYQIIFNLINNSLIHGFKDANYGKIEINITYDNNMVNIVYKDSGIGLTDESIIKIFDPFYTTLKGTDSSGLGMYIVYHQITKALKGSITLGVNPTCGVEFNMNFPVNIEENSLVH